MSRIAINDLNLISPDIDTISCLQAMDIVGGRTVRYLDLDGDGVADVKEITRNNGNLVYKWL
jgi:hypothetical protein